MYKAEELNAELARQNLTKEKLAELVHMGRSTFLRKARQGSFYIDEAEAVAKALRLSDQRMIEIFFA